jgi:hypothetical protein
MTGALVLATNPITAMHATTKQYVDSQVGSALSVHGGNLTGPLTLAADPSAPLHAATKHYVDTTGSTLTGVINVKAVPYGAQINGVADDTAAFKAAYQAAAAGSTIYVPNGVTVLQNPNNWGVPLTKRVKWIVDGTSLPDGTALSDGIPGGNGPANSFLPGIVVGNSNISAEFSQSGSAPTDFAVLHSSYIVNHNGGPVGGGSSPTLTMTRSYMVVPTTTSGAGSIGCCGVALRLPPPAVRRSMLDATFRQSGKTLGPAQMASRSPNRNFGRLAWNIVTQRASHRVGQEPRSLSKWIGLVMALTTEIHGRSSHWLSHRTILQERLSKSLRSLESISEVDPRDTRIEYSTLVSLSR